MSSSRNDVEGRVEPHSEPEAAARAVGEGSDLGARVLGAARFPASRSVLAMFGGLLLMLGWNAWLTRELFELQDRRIVSVSLASLVRDYVGSEARRGATREQAVVKTQLYLAAVSAAMAKLSADGTTVLVGEAVLGNSVPDMTPAVKRAVDRALGEAMPAAPLASDPATESDDGR